MTKLIKTLITGLTIALGASSAAQAGDNTFTVSFKIDKSATVEQNYENFRTNAKLACRQEAERAGWRRTESTMGERRKCEEQILSQALRATKNPMMVALHNQNKSGKVTITKLAKN